MTTHELVHGARVPRPDRVRSFPRLSVAAMREWLQSLAESGYVVERAPDDWELTEDGRYWFAGVAEIDVDELAA